MNGSEKKTISVETGVSIGVIVLGIGGLAWILTAIGSTKADIREARMDTTAAISAVKVELGNRIDKVEGKVNSIESSKNSWTAVDQLKFAIHLQQLNKDPKTLQLEGLKVPEPEISK